MQLPPKTASGSLRFKLIPILCCNLKWEYTEERPQKTSVITDKKKIATS